MNNSNRLLFERIISVLPGGDCGGYGGCGKPSCGKCAEAIAEGGIVNLCPACNQEQVDKIAEITGRESVKVTKQRAFIACMGNCIPKTDQDSSYSCAEIKFMGFQKGSCKNGCIGKGSCINFCKFGAMSLIDGKIVVDEEKCNGCGACSNKDACVQGIIKMIPADATHFIPCSSSEDDEDVVRSSCGFGCIACGECERVCPVGAISIIENHAVINYEKCQGCTACVIKCKKKIIMDRIHNIRELKEKVAFVACKGGYDSGKIYKDKGFSSCKEAVLNSNPKEMNICTTGCSGLGDCINVCRYDAIHMVDGTPKVDTEKCVGCKDCVYICPKNIIKIVPFKGAKMIPCSSVNDYDDKGKICKTGCAGCGDCVDNCPNDAIYFDGKHAFVDPEICENCNACSYICSRGIIELRKVPEYIYLQRNVMKIKEGE